jgi:hypothetical protein
MIAEAWGWLDHALDCGYISSERNAEFNDRWQHIGAMLNRMITRADDFCQAR